jgi:hypothetical protein
VTTYLSFKFKQLFYAFILSCTILCFFHAQINTNVEKESALEACMSITSNLPMSHVNHPCNAVYMPNKSWWAWLSGESKSTHRHFLDFIELIHYSFD